MGSIHIWTTDLCPVNLNIWKMTQEARSNLFNQSFSICCADRASSVPKDQYVFNTLKETNQGQKISLRNFLPFIGPLYRL